MPPLAKQRLPATCRARARARAQATTPSKRALTLLVHVRVREAITPSKLPGLMAVPAARLRVAPLVAHLDPVRVPAVPAVLVDPAVHVLRPVALAVPADPDVPAVLVAVPVAPAALVASVVHPVAVRLLVAVVEAEALPVHSVEPEASLHVHVSPSVPSAWSTRSSKLRPLAA